MNKKFPFFLLFILWLLILSLLIFKLKGLSQEKAVFQTRAWSCGAGALPPAPAGGVDSLQKKINAAKDGEVISLSAGTYSGPTAVPLGLGNAIFVSDARGAAMYCMIRIEGKKITLKGQGPTATIFYGEGHSRPYEDPYQHRAGICVINSTVTFDSVRIKEFQKRGMVVYDSAIVIKNSIIEGHDEGGISLLGNSSGLFVNNFFQAMNFGGVMLWQNSQAKIVNNILNGAGVMFFFHPGTDDKANAEIINNVFSGGSKIVQVDWWKDEAPKLQNVKTSYNFFDGDSAKCTPPLEYCNEFPGKASGDVMYVEPVGDMCGIAPWGNFSFREGSPAIGVGDPTIPGPKILGNAGGPCVEPNSSTCANFISSNLPKKVEPTPTANPNPPEGIDTETQSTQSVDDETNTIYKTTSEVGPQGPRSNNVFSKEQGALYIENVGENKLIRILGVNLQNQNQTLQKELSSGQAANLSYSSLCSGLSLRVKGGLMYQSSDDNFTSVRYKNLDLGCSIEEILGIE